MDPFVRDVAGAVMGALADPHRRRMVERLGGGPLSVSDLARPFTMSLPAVMQHLAVLQACGLVRSEKIGRVRTCRLEPGPLREAETWFRQQRATWECHLDDLQTFLDETAPDEATPDDTPPDDTTPDDTTPDDTTPDDTTPDDTPPDERTS